jgi:hypothetical protein
MTTFYETSHRWKHLINTSNISVSFFRPHSSSLLSSTTPYFPYFTSIGRFYPCQA